MSEVRWIRLDVGMPRNHKILALLAQRGGHKAALAYVFGLTYVGEQGTDGFIPREALPFCHATRTDAGLLVAAGLWHEDPGGWLVHGWNDKQWTSAEAEARSSKARSAAQVRWAKPKQP
jgi:hypothetical protein